MGFGKARLDDANIFASPRVRDDKQSTDRAYAERDEALLMGMG